MVTEDFLIYSAILLSGTLAISVLLFILNRKTRRAQSSRPRARSQPARTRTDTPRPASRGVEQQTRALEFAPPSVPDKYWLWMNLTDREKEIAVLFAEGKGLDEIAKDAGVSPERVEAHIQDIYRKLKVGSPLELTRVLLRIVQYEEHNS